MTSTRIARTAIVLRWQGRALPWSEAGEAVAAVILREIGIAAGFSEPHGKIQTESWDYGTVAGYAMSWAVELSQEEICAIQVLWKGETIVGFVDELLLLRDREVCIDIETFTWPTAPAVRYREDVP